MSRKQTPSQTVGPYFAYGLTPEQYGYPLSQFADGRMAGDDSQGQPIRLQGQVLDGAGAPIPDAMLEIWQADGQGRYSHPADKRGSNTGFAGFGRVGTGTDPETRFTFNTVKPGSIDGAQAPHLNVMLFMRGLLSHAYTRIYFSDEEKANAADPILQSVPVERRATLIASREDTATGPLYRFDIHMQGARETVFFDI